MSHLMMSGSLREDVAPVDLTKMPWLEGIDPEDRERAAAFNSLTVAYSNLGMLPGDLRLSIEPIHPLDNARAGKFVTDQLRSFGVPDSRESFGLSPISKALVGSYVPVADLFFGSGAPDEEPLLYDPLTGFMIWKSEEKVRNYWLGNRRDLIELGKMHGPLKDILIKKPGDHFSIGQSLIMRLVGPRLRTRRPIKFDEANIPTMEVENQKDLELLADELKTAAAMIPGIRVAFRGQHTEHYLPNRRPLVDRGVCEYSDVCDHSLVPSLYRYYDQYLDDILDFRAFIGHLFDWNLYSDLVFGDPARYFDFDGNPYEPIKIRGDAYSTATMYMSGDSGPVRMFEDLGPYSVYEITDKGGRVLDRYVKLHRPGFDTTRRNLILQHYGAPTPLIDVTNDIRVAEWFALNTMEVTGVGLASSGRVPMPAKTAAIYVFCLFDGFTPFVETEHLVTPNESLRPHRQACAVLGGPGNLYRNVLSKFIGLKIKFADSFCPDGLPAARHLFPGPDEDNTLKHLLELYETPQNLSRPFPVYYFPN